MQQIPLYCRLCSNQLAMSENLFAYTHNGVPLIYMLEYCLKYRFSRNVALPQFVCSICVHQIINVYSFHLSCISSEQHFVNTLDEQTRFVQAEQAIFVSTEPGTFDQAESAIFLSTATVHLAPTEPVHYVQMEPVNLVQTELTTEQTINNASIGAVNLQAVQPIIAVNEVADFERTTLTHSNDNVGIAALDLSYQTLANVIDAAPSIHTINNNIPEEMMHLDLMRPPILYKNLDSADHGDEMEVRDEWPPSFLAMGSYDPSYNTETYENLDDITTPTVLFHLHSSDDEDEEIKVYECFDCKRYFVLLEELRQHIPTHNNDVGNVEQLEPSIVHENIIDSIDEMHLRNERPPSLMAMASYEPSDNAETYENLDDITTPTVLFNLQSSDDDEEIQVYQCFDCKRYFVQLDDLRQHIPTHNIQNVQQVESIVVHENAVDKKHLEDEKPPFLVVMSTADPLICAEVYENLVDVTKPIVSFYLDASSDDEKENKVFECFDCKRNFVRLEELRRHVREHNPMNYACFICDIYFKHPKTLIRHRYKHSSYKCQYCPMTASFVKDVDRVSLKSRIS